MKPKAREMSQMRQGGRGGMDLMRANARFALAATAAFVLAAPCARAQAAKEWPIHDRTRPLPPVVDPGSASTPDQPGKPPSDAVVLFDGKDLSGWKSQKD